MTRTATPALPVALLLACAVGESGDAGSFAASGTAAAPSSSPSETDQGGSPDDTTSESGTPDDGASEGDDGSGDPPGDGSSEGSGDAETSGGSPDGGLGPVCAGVGEVSMAGAGGAIAANQNCPHTDFVVEVAGTDGVVADVSVSIDAVAANTSQNRIWLVSPSQTQVLLFDRRGTSFTDDFVGTTFDDQAAGAIAGAPGPFHGCFAPEQALAGLVGQPADGAWTLRVETCLFETSVTAWQLHLEL